MFDSGIFILALRLLMVLAPAIAAVYFWKWRTNVAWACVFAAFGAFALTNLLHPYIFKFTLTNPYLNQAYPGITPPLGLPIISIGIIYGIAQLGVAYAIMRIPVTKITTSQGAVLFGIAYATLTIAEKLQWQIHRAIYHSLLHLGIASAVDETRSTLEMIANLEATTLPPLIDQTLLNFPWRVVFVTIYQWYPTTFLVTVATSIAIFCSVKTRKTWPAAAAVIAFAANHVIIRTTGLFYTREFYPILFDALPFLRFVTEIPGQTATFIFISSMPVARDILAALPAVTLAAYIHLTSRRRRNAPSPI